MSIGAVLSLCTSISLLAIWAIVLWFICPFIGMSDGATKIVRILIVVIAIMSSLAAVLSASERSSISSPDFAPTPNIIAPEHRH